MFSLYDVDLKKFIKKYFFSGALKKDHDSRYEKLKE